MQKIKIEADGGRNYLLSTVWKILSLEATSGSISTLTMAFDFIEIAIALQMNIQIK